MRKALEQSDAIRKIAEPFVDKRDFLYLGRGLQYPMALEGALKLKEISYQHAEGYPAGEMKHGPIALIEAGTPVVALATVRADAGEHGQQHPGSEGARRIRDCHRHRRGRRRRRASPTFRFRFRARLTGCSRS